MENVGLLVNEVHRFVARRVTNPTDAEDIAQQSLLKACQNYAAFRGDNLRAWLLAIARHLIVDHFRAQRRVQFVETEEAARSEKEPALKSGTEAVQDICANRERLTCYLQCISRRLLLEQQVAVLLADVHGYRDKDAAVELGIKLPTYKLLLHVARARLHECAGGRCTLVQNGCAALSEREHLANHNGSNGRNGKSGRNGVGGNGALHSAGSSHSPGSPEWNNCTACPGRLSRCEQVRLPEVSCPVPTHGESRVPDLDCGAGDRFNQSLGPKKADSDSNCRRGLQCCQIVPRLQALRDQLLKALSGITFLKSLGVFPGTLQEWSAYCGEAQTAIQLVLAF